MDDTAGTHRNRRGLAVLPLLFGFASALIAPGAGAQEAAFTQQDQHLPSVWDLKLGAHWQELPTADFIDFACGTDGGPPSVLLKSWSDYASCKADSSTGLHEVYFEYDDEPEYIGRARNLDLQIMRHEHTWVNGVPVIASALFDAAGFLAGLRLVTDPRVELRQRENGMILGGFMHARFGDADWTCADLPRTPGESEFQGNYVKSHCSKAYALDGSGATRLDLDVRNLRRAGKSALAWNNVPTDGEFESSTRFQIVLAEPVPDAAARSAELNRTPPAVDPLLARAMDCPGCDLKGVNLKRADLTGANLAGADLSGANLHGAILAKADLSGANLAGANLNRTDLRRAKLAKADLQKAMLHGSRLDGADLAGAILNGAMAGSARIASADLSGASLRAVDLRDTRLNDSNFSGADLSNSWMHNAQVTRANLSGATLIYVAGHRANFAYANLTGVDTRGADFFGASFRDANLSDADFSFTRLASANMFGAKLNQTNFDQSELPRGFTAP